MTDERAAEIKRNKALRGYIIRALVKGYQNSLIVQHIVNAMTQDGLIISPESVSKHFDYLLEGGYITFTDKSITAYNAYKNDAVVKLTKKGVDLVEGTITDKGVDL